MDTIKSVGSDYIGWQIGSSIVKMKPEFRDSALKVTINSIFYRLLLKGQLPTKFMDWFKNSFPNDIYMREMVVDFISLSVLNLLLLNVFGDKKSYGKTVIKSAIQSFVSSWTYTMIK